MNIENSNRRGVALEGKVTGRLAAGELERGGRTVFRGRHDGRDHREIGGHQRVAGHRAADRDSIQGQLEVGQGNW